MRIRYTFDLAPVDRRAIACHFGDEGLATHDTCKHYMATEGEGGLGEIVSWYLERYHVDGTLRDLDAEEE